MLIGSGAAISNVAPGNATLQRIYPYNALDQVQAKAVENVPTDQSWDFIVAQAICASPLIVDRAELRTETSDEEPRQVGVPRRWRSGALDRARVGPETSRLRWIRPGRPPRCRWGPGVPVGPASAAPELPRPGR